MPTWSEIISEIKNIQSTGPVAFDTVRRKYLKKLHEHTGRNTILYAVQWTQPGANPGLVTITDQDLQGFMEVVHGLEGKKTDIILHSPGGSAEALESIILYLRQRFSHIRVIIPQAAMSAATMFACAANRIIMGEHSFLGPIDPQMIVIDQYGHRKAVPAHTILTQFDMAKTECQNNPRLLSSWAPILSQYGPGLLVQCNDAISLSKTLVSQWLSQYMFSRRADSQTRADAISGYLADYKKFSSHGRHVSRKDARNIGLYITNLESDHTLQDLTLSIFHATSQTFIGTKAVKIIENHNGKAFIILQKT